MITYEVKINGQTIKRVDARRVHALNEAMQKNGYLYKYSVWDYEGERLVKGEVVHKYSDGAGKLLELIWSALPTNTPKE